MRVASFAVGQRLYSAGRQIAAALVLLLWTVSTTAAPPSEEQAIMDLHQQWAEARIKGDIAFLERFYAPEFTINGMDGSVVSRESDIAAFASRSINPNVIEDIDVSVRLYGNTAVVTGVEHVRGTAFGQKGEFWLRFTNVLVKEGDAWRLVQHQSTPIAQ